MRDTVRAESIECFFCKHLFDTESAVVVHACSAWPFGIPDSIIKGYQKHHEVMEEQNGDFIYEKKEGIN